MSSTISAQTSPYPTDVEQKDGTRISILGKGTMHVSYSETLDGYVILLNSKKIYEYAVRGKNGDLKPGGVKARNEGERKPREIKYLRKVPKHLRYEGKKLEALMKDGTDVQN